MRIRGIYGLFLMVVFIGGCIEDNDLNRTIFVRDKYHPELPQYSEWGYNTFGAFINDDVFISGNDNWNPSSVSFNDTSMIFSFQGEKIVNKTDTTEMTLIFSIPGNPQLDSPYLLGLNNAAIDLSEIPAHVLIVSGQTTYPVLVNTGVLYIRRVQNLVVDNAHEEIILSGTFEFGGIMDGNPVNVTLGRFDVGIANFNY
jgi:hypothetical protein